MSSQRKNVFGFTIDTEERVPLEKTAKFFYPNEDGDESSRSTQNTEDGKETSAPNTPDQSIKIKLQGKLFSIKKRIPSAREDKTSDLTKELLNDVCISVKNINKAHNSDEAKSWDKKATAKKNLARLMSEGHNRVLDSTEEKNIIESSNDSLSNNVFPRAPNQRFSLGAQPSCNMPQNLFVIKTTSQNKIRVAKFNKIKALTPIPNFETLMTPTSKNVPLSYRSEVKVSPIDNYLPRRMPDTTRAKPSSSSEIKRVQINTPQNRFISHTKSFSTIGKVPQFFTFDNIVKGAEKNAVTDRDICPEVREFEIPELKIKKANSTNTQNIEEKPKTSVRIGRNLSLNSQDFIKNIDSLKIRNLISPVANFSKPSFLDQFQTPKSLPTIDGAFEFGGLQRKISSGKFKNQEMIVNRIFNPASHQKKNL